MTLFKETFPEIDACQVLECIPEKFVVDFANGIDVVNDHLRSSNNRPFFLRLKEGMSGQSSARQQAINASLNDGIQASLIWLTELTSSLAGTNLAVSRVYERVNTLMRNTAKIAEYSADTREQLRALASHVNQRVRVLEEQLQRVDSIQQGQLHVDRIFSNWSAGRYAALPLAGRCYVALEELRWGAFGDVIRQAETKQAERFIETLKNKALTQMALDYGTKSSARHDTRNWLGWQTAALPNAGWAASLHWMADWCNPDTHPVSWSVTQSGESLPLRMPRICSAERIADTMVDEVFCEDLK
jgi:hypothetical protein